ncbi:MAG: hypothetical protein AB7P76_08455 [Candidatus Melainabacteria bacterium]
MIPAVNPTPSSAQTPAASQAAARGPQTARASAPTFGCIETAAIAGCGCLTLPVIGTVLLVVLNKIRKAVKNMAGKVGGNQTDIPAGE